MSEPLGFSRAARLLVVGASFVVVVAGMRAAAEIIVPVLLAMFLALLCLPAVRWMEGKKVPHALAVPVVLVLTLLLCAVLLAVMTRSVKGFAVEAEARYAGLVQDKAVAAHDWLEERFERPAEDGEAEPKDVVPDEFISLLSPDKVVRLVGMVAGQVTGMIGNLLLIVLLVVFLLFELVVLPAKLAAIPQEGEGHGNFNRIVSNINRYIAIKTFVSVLTGITAGVGCVVLGVPHAVLWALCAFFLNYIPNIGSVLAAIPPVVLCIVLPELGIGHGLGLIGIYFGINFVFGNMVEPRMMGRSLDLSTLIVFVSMVFWGWVFGAVGMFLSVPLTMVLKIALESSSTTQPIALLLGAAVPDGDSTRTAELPRSS